jgi:diguanylate cyclase (GGDEF)-like protein
MLAPYGLIASIDTARAETYRQVIAGCGLDPLVTRDGDAARDAIHTRGAPGLVVTELSLPLSDGFRLLNALRLVATPAETPAIVVTAFADLRDAAERLKQQLGICAILGPRPSPHVLSRVVKRALEREPAALGLLPDEGAHESTRPRAGTPISAFRWRVNDPMLRGVVGDVVRRLKVPMGFVSLRTGERSALAAAIGLPEGLEDVTAMAEPVIAAGELLVIPDADDHPLFALEPRPRPRGFAATPIVTSRGELVGVVGVADDRPLALGPAELEELVLHARRLAGEIELASETTPGGAPSSYLATVLSHLDSGVALVDAEHRLLYGNVALGEMCDLTTARLAGLPRPAFVEALAQLAPDPEEARRRLAVVPGLYGCRAEIELARPRRRVLRWLARPLRLGQDVGQLEVFEDITAAVDLARERELLARTDWLTGLINRRGGDEAIAREVARARRLGSSLCFALFDIDRFKLVNDVHGHAVGDEVLREVARVLLGAVRGSDLAVRWGGDELLVVLPAVPEGGARIFAERVRKRVAALEVAGAPPVTVSCGVAELGRFEDGATTVARADARLYEAKAEGRNRVK